MTKTDRAIILTKTNGRCAYCGTSLGGVRWHADHIEAVWRDSGNNNKMSKKKYHNIDNLIASCPSCNITKSVQSIEQFREYLQNFTMDTLRTEAKYKNAIRFGLIQETQKSIIFYFETLNG